MQSTQTSPIAHPRVALGSVLVSLLEAVPGHEVALNRWYERDHFYAGCMLGPGFFAGRRFVATRSLKDLRFPTETPVIDDIAKGSFLALYWILEGHHQETLDWAVQQVNWLNANDRMLPERVQAHAGFYHLRWTSERDPDGVPSALALDHPFPSVALVMTDRAEGVTAPEFAQAYRDRIDALSQGSPIALCLGLEPEPLPADAPSYVLRPEGLERRSLQIFFLDEDPDTRWDTLFLDQQRWMREQGLGEISFAAPFIPTVPGTDRFTDELW